MSENLGDGQTIAQLYRRYAGQVLAALISRLGDFQLAEDALQDAWLQATRYWPQQGVPRAPDAWLLTVARRKAIDHLRRLGTQQSSAAGLQLASQLENEWPESDEHIPDDRLRLIFTCCHPALKFEHQVALTLHTLCGLSTEEIARAFLIPTSTLAQRIVRAKRKIRLAKIPYRVPEQRVLAERSAAVRAVIYLTFNEGYAASGSDSLIRDELCAEAIRLGRFLNEQLNEAENAGLLALMLLHDSRRPARLSDQQIYIPLDQQDRSLWKKEPAAEGKSILLRALALGRPGPYQIQAAISALHSDAETSAATDWSQIVGLYKALMNFTDTPVIQLNHAIAVARAGEPALALEMTDLLAGSLLDYQPFYAARADLLKTLGKTGDAFAAYEQAIALTNNSAERNYLLKLKQELNAG